MELRVATNKEHVPSNSVGEHLLSCDSIIAKSKENPAYVSLYLNIIYQPQWVEQIHYAFLDQYINRLFAECKMDQS